MENISEENIFGDIFIPLENNLVKKKENEIDEYEDMSKIFEQDYKKFRGIIFQNELLRFFLVLKIDNSSLILEKNINLGKIEELVNNLYLKIEFSQDLEKNNDLFELKEFNSDVTNFGNLETEIKENIINDILSHNNMTRKKIIPEKNIAIIEVKKKIILPFNFINKNLIFKIRLLKRNNIDFMKKISIDELPNYKYISEFIIIKSLYKEVRIKKPICVSHTKQFDCSPEKSIVIIKLENITSKINFIDESLKGNQFLKSNTNNEFDEDENENEDEKVILHYPISFFIKEIAILKDKTTIDKKMTLYIDKFEQHSDNDEFPISIDSILFNIANKDFPIEIKPGEEYNILLKIEKGRYFFESDLNSKDSSSEEEEEKKNKSIFSLLSFKRKNKSNSQNFDKISENTSLNVLSKMVTTMVDSNEEKLNNDEIVKLRLNTPILVFLDHNEIYDNIMLMISMKWQTDIFHKLYIKMKIIDKEIKLFQFFSVILSIKNTTDKVSEFYIEFNNSIQDKNIGNLTEIIKRPDDNIPDILNEFKKYDIGVLNPNSKKDIKIRFFPMKKGDLYPPTFNIIDKTFNQKFFIVFTNKVFIE